MAVPQKEAERFEQAIVSTSAQGGRQGIVILPGAKSIIDEVRVSACACADSRLKLAPIRVCAPAPACDASPECSMGNLHICDPGLRDFRPRTRGHPHPRRVCRV